MKLTLLSKLVCPECGSSFKLTVLREGNPGGTLREVEEGLLFCKNKHNYQIEKYVPRFRKGQTQRTFEKLQEKTEKSFGFEWKKWGRFGWDEGVSLEQTREIFDYKVMFTRSELKEKLVLDAGCGNGRYTQVAAEYGGEVIGIDLSGAADVAFENTKTNPLIHIVQGDLFKTPFKDKLFDFIFSNGVLMHTGDAKKAFFSLVLKLKESGVISIHLYHKGNFIYEFNDWWLRAITTHLSLSVVYYFARALAFIASILPKSFVEYGLNAIFRIESHVHYIFDWYTAPIATHHTYNEVYGWLKEAKLFLTADHNITRYPWRKYIFPFLFLTVKAGRKPPNGPQIHSIS